MKTDEQSSSQIDLFRPKAGVRMIHKTKPHTVSAGHDPLIYRSTQF